MNSPDNGSRNRLLAMLSRADRALLGPSLEVVAIDARQIIDAARSPISHAYFVETPTIASRSAWWVTKA